MGKKSGQSSIEFLYATGLMLLLFTISVLLYLSSQSDLTALSSHVEARRICTEIAAQIAAVDAAGSGAEATLRLPPALAAANYTVYIMGVSRSVSVVYGGQGVGCRIPTSNVTYGGQASFNLTQDARIRNVDGGVVLG